MARARDGAGLEIAFDAVPLTDEVVGDIRPTLYVLFGTVAMVLLIACANAANLLVARANSRRREIVIRQALGADRGRIVQQILTESVLLALAAGVVGVLMSYWGLDLLLATWPDSLPRVQDVTIDRSVLAFTFLVSLATGIGFGLVPALRAFHPAIEEALREDSGGLSGGRSRQRTQRVMVAAELAVALVLLVSAGLLVRSFTRLMEVDPGYDTHDVLAARVRLTPSRYPDRASRRDLLSHSERRSRRSSRGGWCHHLSHHAAHRVHDDARHQSPADPARTIPIRFSRSRCASWAPTTSTPCGSRFSRDAPSKRPTGTAPLQS